MRWTWLQVPVAQLLSFVSLVMFYLSGMCCAIDRVVEKGVLRAVPTANPVYVHRQPGVRVHRPGPRRLHRRPAGTLAVGDRESRRRSERRIQELQEAAGTVLLVGHSMRSIRKTCNRTLWMERGGLRMDGPTEEVVTDYWNHVTS